MYADEPWVTVVEMDDPVMAETYRQLLENHEIPSSTPGLEHRSMLGPIGGYIRVSVQVPERRSREARDLYDAFVSVEKRLREAARGMQAQEDAKTTGAQRPGPERPGLETTASGEVPRLRVVESVPSASPNDDDAIDLDFRKKGAAAFFSVISFMLPVGFGHLYAREYLTSVLIGCGWLLGVVGPMVGAPDSLVWLPVLGCVYDFFGSMLAVDRANAKKPAPLWMQATITSAVLLLSAAAAPTIDRFVSAPSRYDAASEIELQQERHDNRHLRNRLRAIFGG